VRADLSYGPCFKNGFASSNGDDQPNGKYVCAKLKYKTKLRWWPEGLFASGYHAPIEIKIQSKDEIK